MTDRAILALLALPLGAQVLVSKPVEGKYHFVQIALSGGSVPEIRNLGGSITLDGRGGFQYSGRMGSGSAAAKPVTGRGKYSIRSEGRLSMESPALPGSTLEVLFGPDGAVLAGSPADNSHGIFVAAKASEGAVDESVVQGSYAGGYLSFRGGEVRGLTTGFVELHSQGKGKITSASFLGHSASIDDVNRAENPAAMPYTARADGSGTIRFPDRSDIVQGDRELMISAKGEMLLAFGAGASDRDILVAVRKAPDASLHGLFWLADLCGANSFAFHPEKARINSGWGAIVMDGGGSATLFEHVWTGNRRVNLTTSMIYRVSSDGSGLWSPRLVPDLKNLAIGGAARVFAGAQVGLPGKLTLEHGIFVAVRAPAVNGPGVFLSPFGVSNAAAPAPLPAPIAPGSAVSLFGSGLASQTIAAPPLPVPELGGVRVTVNGSTVPILRASSQRIDVLMPFSLAPGQASIQVDNNGVLSNVVTTTVAATSPAVYTENRPAGAPLVFHANSEPVSDENPARPGKTIVIHANGLGVVEPATDPGIGVLFNGRSGKVSFAGLVPGKAGVYQIRVVVPNVVPVAGRVSLAIATSDGFADLADIAVVNP